MGQIVATVSWKEGDLGKNRTAREICTYYAKEHRFQSFRILDHNIASPPLDTVMNTGQIPTLIDYPNSSKYYAENPTLKWYSTEVGGLSIAWNGGEEYLIECLCDMYRKIYIALRKEGIDHVQCIIKTAPRYSHLKMTDTEGILRWEKA